MKQNFLIIFVLFFLTLGGYALAGPESSQDMDTIKAQCEEMKDTFDSRWEQLTAEERQAFCDMAAEKCEAEISSACNVFSMHCQ